MNPYRILERKRRGEVLSGEEIAAAVAGVASDEWNDAQVGALLMAVAIHGLGSEELTALTAAMLESGERWDLVEEIPNVVDKHSTGGVGDKVSLLLAPLLAACDLPVAMLTGRSLGHTGGTADKLESIPGLRLELDRASCLRALRQSGFAIGVATTSIAPADRRLYALRDLTGTVSSLPLIVSSILSKKLAAGAAAIVFDVKVGSGAFLPPVELARELAGRLVEISRALGCPARALVSDMSQPLGDWVGHTAEVREVYDAFAGEGDQRLLELTFALCAEVSALVGARLEEDQLRRALASGAARERFERWARGQGADSDWLRAPRFTLAPVEVPLLAPRAGVLAAVDNRQLGLLLGEAGAGRSARQSQIDVGVALRYRARLGDAVAAEQELARLFLRRADDALARRFLDCFTVAAAGQAPPLVHQRLPG